MQLYLCLWLWVLCVLKLATTGHVELGVGVNIFSMFGDLSLIMRVIARNDTDPTWLFRQPTPPVFIVPDSSSYPEGDNAWDFHMEFCDDVDQLLESYFRGFRLESVDDSWRAFSLSWSPNTLGRKLGLPQEYLEKYAYVVVRLSRTRREAAIEDLGPLDSRASDILEQVEPEDEPSVHRTFAKLGTHYVHSFATGNALYQVLVYQPSSYRKVKTLLRRPQGELDVVSLLSPPHVYHAGPILAASGNMTAATLASLHLTPPTHRDASLIALQNNPQVLPLLEPLLGNEAILRLELRTLDRALDDQHKRLWFQEVIFNTLQLWEVNA